MFLSAYTAKKKGWGNNYVSFQQKKEEKLQLMQTETRT